MIEYQNGNAKVSINESGTRMIEYENDLNLDFPLNIDIRVMNKCAFGYNPKTKKAFCTFCHESARTDGNECDYEILKYRLKSSSLPAGIELAIGANEITEPLVEFLQWAFYEGFICNLTINQGHLKRDSDRLKSLIKNDYIKGLGVSYRSGLKFTVPQFVLDYEHTVFHVISGIDDIMDVLSLNDFGVKKILVLGEKDFGFNKGKVDLNTQRHKHWYWWIGKCIETFELVSFDNLALEQLNVKRLFVSDFETFDQGEHSFYINAVDGYLAPSSRNDNKTYWDGIDLREYFCSIKK